jgi:hypothetical protein
MRFVCAPAMGDLQSEVRGAEGNLQTQTRHGSVMPHADLARFKTVLGLQVG